MNKSEIRILILEDDVTLSKAIDEALKRAGYTTQVAKSYSEAKNSTKFTDFHGVVADCMLPQKSGVDVTLELLEESSHDVVVVLMSGIFKDKSYAHDAQIKTHARAFLSKPFDIKELVRHFDEAFQSLTDGSGDPLYQLLTREQSSTRDKLTALKAKEFVHGYDLPYVYALLSESLISGDLSIEYEDRPRAVIGFQRGQIDRVDFPDTESYFGALLIEKGFATAEEIKKGLEEKGHLLLGHKLVENSQLSPHAIEVIQHEQMVIRISKTICDANVKINFIEVAKPEPKVSIDTYLFAQLLSDWLCSKVTHEWLTFFYTPWMESPIIKGPEWGNVNKVRMLSATATFCSRLETAWPQNVQEILQGQPEEAELLRGLHFLLLQRVVMFGKKYETSEKFDVKMARLEKIWKNFKGQNHFEILGVNPKAKTSEILRAYHELAKNLHPDKLNPNSPPQLKELAQMVFSKITEAHQTLSSEKRRKEYMKVLELGLADEIMRSESVFEEGLRFLKNSQFREARKAFDSTLRLKGHRSDTVVYFLWALIKEKRNKSDRIELLTRIQPYMNQIAHEDRHSAQYFFIKGMAYELEGQIQKAYKHLRHSTTIDPYFLDAKREMTYIKKHYTDQPSKTNTQDFSTVVTKLFKKRSG